MTTTAPEFRRVRFRWPEDLDPNWTPQSPELAVAANAVSLLMPHAEPYVVASVRAATKRVNDPDLAAAARTYAAQEAQHHAQHREYNDRLVARYRGIARLDRLVARVFGFLRRRGDRFGLAFAAGFETIAFVAARWVDGHLALLRGAEPRAATLFLWHLAEEVEHKEIAWDLYEADGGGRVRYAVATWTAGIVLAVTALVATWTMLAGEGRLTSPVAHLRLARWSLSFVFAAVPVMIVSSLPGHHPSQLTNPAGLDHWLDSFDAADATAPEWALP